MRTAIFFVFLATVLSPVEGENQIQELEGVYLGRVEGGYSFSCKTAHGIEERRIFDKVLSVVLEKYPLHLNKHIGERFTIAFATSEVISEAGTKEISTILRLHKPLPGHRTGASLNFPLQ